LYTHVPGGEPGGGFTGTCWARPERKANPGKARHQGIFCRDEATTGGSADRRVRIRF